VNIVTSSLININEHRCKKPNRVSIDGSILLSGDEKAFRSVFSPIVCYVNGNFLGEFAAYTNPKKNTSS